MSVSKRVHSVLRTCCLQSETEVWLTGVWGKQAQEKRQVMGCWLQSRRFLGQTGCTRMGWQVLKLADEGESLVGRSNGGKEHQECSLSLSLSHRELLWFKQRVKAGTQKGKKTG